MIIERIKYFVVICIEADVSEICGHTPEAALTTGPSVEPLGVRVDRVHRLYQVFKRLSVDLLVKYTQEGKARSDK